LTGRVVLRPQAEAEIQAAYDWYENAVRGLGDRFLQRLDAVFDRVAESPQQFPEMFGFRRTVVPSFPYCVYFRELGEEVVVVAVLHGRRSPVRLRGRS